MTQNNRPAWRQTIYYPYQHASRFGRGTVLLPVIDSPRYDSRRFKGVPYLEAIAVDNEDGYLTVFAVNRHLEEELHLAMELRGYGELRLDSHTVLAHADCKAANTMENADNVVPRNDGKTTVGQDGIDSVLPPLSWNVIRFKKSNLS
jgi:alpha-N-arabinofuranosidase